MHTDKMTTQPREDPATGHPCTPEKLQLTRLAPHNSQSRHERTALSGAEVASRATNNRQVLDAD